MITNILFLSFLTACQEADTDKTSTEASTEDEKEFGFSEETDSSSEDSGVPEDTGSEEPEEEEPPPLILAEGRWNIPEAQVLSDVCNVGNFNSNLTETVPSTLEISNSSEGSFFIDSDTECEISGLEFICGKQFLEEETWGAVIGLSNVMYGTISDEENINILFDVEVLSCSDSALCLGMEAVLDLPCLIELETVGQKN